jgi:hypothetical protein
MFRILVGMALVAAAVSSAGKAQPLEVDENVWSAGADKAPRPKLVDIGVPRSAGPLLLRRLHAFRPDGLDNGAQYASADGAVIGTIYIYRAGYPDAGYAMLMTGEAIRARFAGAQPGREELVAAGGVAAGARKRLFDGGVDQTGAFGPVGATLTAGLATLRASEWVVKIRVTGPADRRADVASSLDALVSGLNFGSNARVIPGALDTITDCSVTEGQARAQRLNEDHKALALMVISGLNTVDPKAPAPAPRKLCVMARRQTSSSLDVVIRDMDGPDGPSVMLMGDAGNALTILAPMDGISKGWALISSTTDKVTMYGPFDRAPNAQQLIDIFEKHDTAWAGDEIASVTRNKDGNYIINLAVK